VEELIKKKDEDITVEDISKPLERLAYIRLEDLLKLPPPYDKPGEEPEIKEPNPEWSEKYVTELDGFVAIDVPWKPKTRKRRMSWLENF